MIALQILEELELLGKVFERSILISSAFIMGGGTMTVNHELHSYYRM